MFEAFKSIVEQRVRESNFAALSSALHHLRTEFSDWVNARAEYETRCLTREKVGPYSRPAFTSTAARSRVYAIGTGGCSADSGEEGGGGSGGVEWVDGGVGRNCGLSRGVRTYSGLPLRLSSVQRGTGCDERGGGGGAAGGGKSCAGEVLELCDEGEDHQHDSGSWTDEAEEEIETGETTQGV